MLAAYPSLRVVLMSATIDTTMFSQYFNDCPVIEVEGKVFPVQGKIHSIMAFSLVGCHNNGIVHPPIDKIMVWADGFYYINY